MRKPQKLPVQLHFVSEEGQGMGNSDRYEILTVTEPVEEEIQTTSKMLQSSTEKIDQTLTSLHTSTGATEVTFHL